MSRDLEGLGGSVALAREQAQRHFPVRGGHMCPVAGFVISLEACGQRCRQDQREPGRHLCDRQACDWYGRMALPKPVTARRTHRHPSAREAPVMPDYEETVMEEERKHKYGERALPEGAGISRTGKVWRKSGELVPCPHCPSGWMSKHSRTCESCWTPDPAPAAANLAKARAAKALKRQSAEKVARTEHAIAHAEQALAEAVRAGATHWRGEQTPKRAEPAEPPDLINHPPHYEAGGFEALPIVRALGFDFEEGSAFKYLFRHKRKGMPLEDLKKCRFFLNALIARYEGEGAKP